MHPAAWEMFQQTNVAYERIGQTVGTAAASAGTHNADGHYTDPADGHQYEYTAAVDFRVQDLTDAQIWSLLGDLSVHGFAAFYRSPGHDGWPSTEIKHVHAVFCGVPMKETLQRQVMDYLSVPPKDGLAHHHNYLFFAPSKFARGVMTNLFLPHKTIAGTLPPV